MTKKTKTYESNPVYDNTTNQLQITFSNGDGCREKTRKKKSIVTFVCKPGMYSDYSSKKRYGWESNICISLTARYGLFYTHLRV
jgi:ATP-dependent Zn protease